MISEPASDNNPTPDTNRKSDIQTDNTKPNVPLTLGVTSPPPTHAHCETTFKTEKHWWDTVKPFVEMIGIALLAVYTGYTIKIFCANQKAADAAQNTLGQIQQQTTLMRKQLVGTEAAVLDVALTYNDGSRELFVQLSNNGHVTATDIHLTIDASQRRIEDDTWIGEPFHIEMSIQPKPSGKSMGQTWIMPWHLTEYERQQGGHWPPDWPGKRTFVFRVYLAYQDGFDNPIRQDVCKQWLPGFSIDYKGQHSAGGGLYDCAEVKSFIKSTLEQEKEAEKDGPKAK